uniref:Endonuclease/exonuclease/phosphatase domain-containing protein n=1 Tax=Aplanochytrium stocchinoi TaxID=215587 RepID=A0A7S3V086_9STRA|mmetsp:Transcript_15280/g.18034  ORF Transcript_15280/g.18034 Transcript_15280/m.18034 type:complete len:681 (-) Transcript_15280:2012-4054(-)
MFLECKKLALVWLLLLLFWDCVAASQIRNEVQKGEEDTFEYLNWLPLMRGDFVPVSVVGVTTLEKPVRGWSKSETKSNFMDSCDKLKGQGDLSFGNILNTFECIPLEKAGNLDTLTKMATEAVGKPVKVTRIRKLHLSPTLNDLEPLQLNMIDQFSNQIIYNVSVGINWYVSAQESESEEQFENKLYSNIVHNLAWSYGRDSRFVLIQHSIGESDSHRQPEYAHEDPQKTGPNPLLRVLSYNIWNTMPHISRYWSYHSRFERYSKRLNWFLSHLKEAAADIICLQEVRSDWTLPVQYRHQMSQLTSVLIPMGYSYYVFQSAMSYYGKQEFDADERTEEGVAIFSKFPIVSTSYKLLSRDKGNPLDEHQRIVLHARVDVNGYIVDTFVTHLSLNKESRFRSALDILDFANKTQMVTYRQQPPALQVIAGDLNAEATDDSIRMFQGLMVYNGTRSMFKDAWLEHFKEPRPRSYKFHDMRKAFTFPSDEPKKRIDFIFYSGHSVTIRDAKLIGLEPEEKQRGKKQVGMEMPNSALYASDHRGLLIDAALLPTKNVLDESFQYASKDECLNTKETRNKSEEEPLDIRQGCIATLTGSNWAATFLYGAYTFREEGGFREKGARTNSRNIRIVHPVNIQFGKCEVNIFENGDYSGANFTFRESGEYNLKQAGYLGRKVEAIEVLLV